MSLVVVLATGGTIASTQTPSGAVSGRMAGDLLAVVDGPPGVRIEAHDVWNLGSYLLTHHHMRVVAEQVEFHCSRPEVDGVVVTHGTDTMTETAYLCDLVHTGDKPVVFTGAQRASDSPDTDGPANLADAIVLAASPAARGCGVLICFSGTVLPAAVTRKAHTIAPQPLAATDGGPIGRVTLGRAILHARPLRPQPLPVPRPAFDGTRVDVVVNHPGADEALAVAAVAAGARGVILAGTGAGNGNHAFVEWVRHATSDGVAVGLSTRVPEGPVVPIYGNGGAVSLIEAGALNLGGIPLFHARLLLALLLSRAPRVDEEALAPYR